MSKPPPKRYSPYGQWAAQATKVKLMVHQGWGISAATREIVAKKGYKDPDKAFKGIRAAYYELVKREKRKKEEFEI